MSGTRGAQVDRDGAHGGGARPGPDVANVTDPGAPAGPVRVDLVFEPGARRVRVPHGVTMFDAASWNGIAIEDIVIDPLAMPVGADTTLGLKTLETIAALREEFGVNMTLGASNVSFGMPDRHTIGAAFLPMAISEGLTSAIMDARSPQIVRAVKAADLLLDRDAWGAAWIAAHRAQQAQAVT